MGRRGKRGGFRKALRRAYRVLSVLNTVSYILGAGTRPGALVKHLARKRVSKLGSRLIR